eukprot:2629496-Prymnesium_polylepis.1
MDAPALRPPPPKQQHHHDGTRACKQRARHTRTPPKRGRQATAVAVRRNDGIQLLVDLLASNDIGVKLASVCAIMNVVGSDLKSAAAIRDAEGLAPLVQVSAVRGGLHTGSCRRVSPLPHPAMQTARASF